MGAAELTASAALQLPVRLRGIQLGRPTDLLLDVEAWQALGFVVLCGDEVIRFLPYATAEIEDDELRVPSALMLLDGGEFYEERGASFRSLLDGEVEGGVLRDVVLGPRGEVVALELDRGDGPERVPSTGAVVVPTRAPAA